MMFLLEVALSKTLPPIFHYHLPKSQLGNGKLNKENENSEELCTNNKATTLHLYLMPHGLLQ